MSGSKVWEHLIEYLEIARVALDRFPETVAEQMDLSDEELARLTQVINEFMSNDEAAEPTVPVTPTRSFEIGHAMWYAVTDDECRLRRVGPDGFGNHLRRTLFPEK